MVQRPLMTNKVDIVNANIGMVVFERIIGSSILETNYRLRKLFSLGDHVHRVGNSAAARSSMYELVPPRPYVTAWTIAVGQGRHAAKLIMWATEDLVYGYGIRNRHRWASTLTLIDRIIFTERGEPSGVEATSSKKQYVRVPRLRILHSSRFTTLSFVSCLLLEAFRAFSISGVSTWVDHEALTTASALVHLTCEKH